MRRPPCKYPKQPTGPSATGSATVRRMQDVGGAYQRSRKDASTLSVQSGDFSKVVVSNIAEYLTTGQDGKQIRRDTQRYRNAFTPSVARLGGGAINMEDGVYLYARSAINEGEANYFGMSYDYEVKPGTDETLEMTGVNYWHQAWFRGYYTGKVLMLDYTGFYAYQVAPGQTTYLKTQDDLAFYGDRTSVGKSGVGIASGFAGRTDGSGRTLQDLILYRMSRREDNQSFLIDTDEFLPASTECIEIAKVLVLKDATVVCVAEKFFRPGVAGPGDEDPPKFMLVVTPNDETFGVLTYVDVTSSLFSGARQPQKNFDGPTEYFGVNSGRQYNIDLSSTMARLLMTAVADNEFVMSWQQRMPAGWRQRVAHVSVTGSSASGSLTFESDESSSLPLWQSITYLGNGVVLAKVINGWPGIDKAVSFRRSNDKGQTWSAPFTPVGFDAPLLNQYFGVPITDSAMTDAGDSTILVTSWNPGSQSYHVYESKDVGASWTRKGRVYKPSEFRRIDTILAGDGGGNFDVLLPGPSRTRPADIALPDRYKGRP